MISFFSCPVAAADARNFFQFGDKLIHDVDIKKKKLFVLTFILFVANLLLSKFFERAKLIMMSRACEFQADADVKAQRIIYIHKNY